MDLQRKWKFFVFMIVHLFDVCQCLMPFGSSSTTTVLTPPSWYWSPDCGEFWVKDSTSGYCYHFSNTSLTWLQAQAQCQNLGSGSQLASINNIDEQHFIEKYMWGFQPPALWIGVNTLNTGTGYHWSDGSPFSFLNWSPGEPNNVFNIEHCGELVTDGPTWGKWNDNNCNSLRGYICKKPSPGMTTVAMPPLPPTPSGYFYGCPGTQWRPYKGNCYLFNSPGTGWANATQYCVLQGGKLASIADENEQNFVLSQLPAKTDRSQYWIGLNDILTQMDFMWSDGSPVRYTNWAENEPNNFMDVNEDCVGMFLKDGTWNDENCKNSLSGFVCKARKKLLRVGTPQRDLGTGCSVRNSLALGYSCYLLKESLKTWSAAQIYCKAYGGNLVVIQDRYQQAFLASQIAGNTGNYWIGLSNGGNTSATGETINYTAWSANYTKTNDTVRQSSTCIAMKTQGPGVGLWIGSSCAMANKYICQYPRTGFSTPTTTTTTSTTPPVCPSTWHQYNGYCYKAYTQQSDRRTWWESRDFCKAMGANLISLHSTAEETFAFSYTVIQTYTYNEIFWIGANDFDVEKGYKWSDGSTWAYTNWKTGEPNDIGGDDDCVERYQSSRNWNDNNCYAARPFICKMQLGQQLKTLPPMAATTVSASCAASPGWLPYNGSCYYMSQQYGLQSTKTWFDARIYCMQHGGDLASAHSEQENGFITTLVSLRDLNSWLGLTMLGTGSFGWSDGSMLDYGKWLPGEPTNANGNEKCGMIFAFNGYWNDQDCNQLFHFVCKRPMGTVHAHTPSPTPLIAGGCPQGYTGVHKNNKCYKVFGSQPSDRKNYTSARDHCKMLGDDLASMIDHIELATVISLINGQFSDEAGLWIGLNDMNHNRRYTWQDSAPLIFTNWAKGQPGYGYQDNCVEMFTDQRRAGKWGTAQCSLIKGYVCEATRKTTLPTGTPPPQGNCQSGYLQNLQFDCFKVHTTPKNWAQANTSCHAEGTNLVSILSVFDQTFVDILTADITTPVWIGLADERNTGTYSWVDNWEVYYTSWDENEPTHKAGGGCVATQNGYWKDTVCNNTYPYICKQSQLTPPTPTISSGYCADPTWKQFGGSCYYVALSAHKSWAESEHECKSRGMELASILSKRELLFVLREIDYSPAASTDVWIGLIRHIDGHFIWSDGSAVNYLPWDDGQPSNTTSSTFSGSHVFTTTHEDCVELRFTSGKWNDETCSSYNGYVCKTQKLPATSPPPSGAMQQPAFIG